MASSLKPRIPGSSRAKKSSLLLRRPLSFRLHRTIPQNPPRSCRAKRIWADVARELNVDAGVIEDLVFCGVLKLYDPRVTETSLTRFCARYGALIKTDFLDAETRDWLAGSMDLAPNAGKEVAPGLEAFRKLLREL